MTDSPFTARAAVTRAVQDIINATKCIPNKDGLYTLNDSDNLERTAIRALTAQYNPQGEAGGFAPLTTPGSKLEKIKTTSHATLQSILAQSKAEAEADPANRENTPTITEAADAQDKADRYNTYVQAALGAKQGVADAIAAQVGESIINPVLREPLSDDLKSIDD